MSQPQPRVLVASSTFATYCHAAQEELARHATCVRERLRSSSVDSLAQHISAFDALILGVDANLTADVLARVRRLKVIARFGVGLDNVDLAVATKQGILVTYTPGANRDSVAEHTMALILGAMRKVAWGDRIVRSHRWADREKFETYDLRGKTLGLIGMGTVGRRVAEIASFGFHMRVLGYDPYVSRQLIERSGAAAVPLDTVIGESDVLSLHAALTPETRRLVNDAFIARMKLGAVLVNTSRGALIDESALQRALDSGKLAYAALDVFETEPPDASPLLASDRVVVTPHLSGTSYEAKQAMGHMIAEDLIRFFSGGTPEHVANPEVLPKLGLAPAAPERSA